MAVRNKEIKAAIKELDGITDYKDAVKLLAKCFYERDFSLETVLLLALEYGQKHPQWRSVLFELPKHDVEECGLVSYPSVLVCLEDGYCDITYYNTMNSEWGDFDGEVAYWMPLPEAPKED